MTNKQMTQAEFINSFPSESLAILPGGNITLTPSSPEALKAINKMKSQQSYNSSALKTFMSMTQPVPAEAVTVDHLRNPSTNIRPT